MATKTAFNYGRFCLTAAVNQLYFGNLVFADFVSASFKRHLSCDWGDMDAEDKLSNDEALKTGERLFSAYIHGVWKIWIITERDRSATTVLFPEDY